MKKKLLLLFVILCAIFASAFSINEWRNEIYDLIKTETIKGLNQAFNTSVSIGKAEGPIIGQVIFSDVKIPGFAQAEKVYVNYNLLEFASYRDIVPAISKITIENAKFRIERDRKNQINALNLLPPEDPNAPPPPPFHARLIFKDCEINYLDQLGFRKEFNGFSENIKAVNGSVSFKIKDRININLSGKITHDQVESPVNIKGFSEFKTGKYLIDVSAKKMAVKKWANYAVPLEFLNFQGGEVDLNIKLSPPKTRGWPLSMLAKFIFRDASADFDQYKIENASGNLVMEDENLTFSNASISVNKIPLSIDGKFYNFKKLNLDLKISTQDADLSRAIAFFDQTAGLDLKGSAVAEITLKGSIFSPLAQGTVSTQNSSFYKQNFSAKSTFNYANKILKINILNLNAYQGNISGNCLIDFKKEIPSLSLDATLRNLDINSIAQKSPGLEGKMNGKLKLSGPLNNLNGSLSAQLNNALLLGQSIDRAASNFRIIEGNIEIDNLSASSRTASIKTSGSITRDMFFDFSAQAQGIKLSGKGIFGAMEATVDSFEGKVSWKLDEKFLTSPLKNINASGRVSLSKGRIGEQLFELAQGNLTMGDGLIRVSNLILQQKESVLKASGQTGIGYPTNLVIEGTNLDLQDLKILNHILPEEAKDPTGSIDVAISVTGELPKETKITSLEPLFDLNASGEVIMKNVIAAEVPIISGSLSFAWRDRKLFIPECLIKTAGSNFSFELGYEKESLKGSARGTVDLAEFAKFTQKYGDIKGTLGINLLLSGSLENLGYSASFWLDSFVFNTIEFDRVSGSLTFANDLLVLSSPITFLKGQSRYEISGKCDFKPLREGRPEDVSLDANLKIGHTDLSSVFDLVVKIQSEISRRFFVSPEAGKTKIDFSGFILPSFKDFLKGNILKLYAANGSPQNFLAEWNKIADESKEKEAATTEKNLGGDFVGNLSLSGKVANLSGEFLAEVKKGFLFNYRFDNLKSKVALKENRILVENFQLSKNRGVFLTQGMIGLDGSLSLSMVAQRMPVDILRMLFNKNFEGIFNMNAAIQGNVTNPQGWASVSATDLTLAGNHFDRASVYISKQMDRLDIQEFNLIEEDRISSIKGSIDLAGPGYLDLKAELHNNSFGLMNLITDEIQWESGKASAQISITGTSKTPSIDGQLEVVEAVIYARVIDSDIKHISGKAKIVENQLQISTLTGFWEGKTSKGRANPLGLSGSIDLSQMLSENKMVKLDLDLSPTDLLVDLSNLFSGTIKVREAKLSGPLYFDLSAGPTIKGKAEIKNSLITLSLPKGRKGKAFPLNLDLTVDLDKNVYAVMGDISTFDLSNIFMNIEVKSRQLMISGSLEEPSLRGDIFLGPGTVTIFNREFSLLSKEQQDKFYPFNAERVKDNIAVFRGKKGKEGMLPEITAVARVDVENPQVSDTGEITYQNVIILSHLEGKIGSAQKDEVLKVTFDSFTEDKINAPGEYIPAGYSAQEIKVMLLPDFIKSLAGVEKADVNTSGVVADYLNSRVQAYLFRGIERDLEQKLGLESLRLEYNFGKDFRRAMGVTERSVLEGERPDWRVGFVKGFFDRFYIDVNYSEFSPEGEQPGTQLFEYQLTYKLSRIWSIIYYREPTSLQELSTGYQKITLKAGFSFW
jgi:hypothetical protein